MMDSAQNQDLSYYVAYTLTLYTARHLMEKHSSLKCEQPRMLMHLETLKKGADEICVPVLLKGELNQYIVFLFSKKIIHSYYQTAPFAEQLENGLMLKDAAVELVNVVCGHMIKKRKEAPCLDFRILPETDVCLNYARMTAFHTVNGYGRIIVVLLENK